MAKPSHAAQPAPENRLLADVRAGFAKPQKQLSPKYFYDERGSRLFEDITRLPEYYLTRTERAILEARMPELVDSLRPRAFVELGAGSAEKSRVILDAMKDADLEEVYVPVDVSIRFLEEVAKGLRKEYAGFRVVPVEADISETFELPSDLPSPTLFGLLGSTVGNFPGLAAVRLLNRVRLAMKPGDRFLMGADLKKDPVRINAAYNDARGVTAEFNKNMLRVLNHELDADFDVDAFEHRAAYDEDAGHVEMHLVARGEQHVTIPGIGTVDFRDGESIHTETSCKFDRQGVERLFEAARMELDQWWTDPERLFVLALARS